jgi:hypothetical protein
LGCGVGHIPIVAGGGQQPSLAVLLARVGCDPKHKQAFRASDSDDVVSVVSDHPGQGAGSPAKMPADAYRVLTGFAANPVQDNVGCRTLRLCRLASQTRCHTGLRSPPTNASASAMPRSAIVHTTGVADTAPAPPGTTGTSQENSLADESIIPSERARPRFQQRTHSRCTGFFLVRLHHFVTWVQLNGYAAERATNYGLLRLGGGGSMRLAAMFPAGNEIGRCP